MWSTDLLGLLYHTTVDRKDILSGAVLPAAHAHDKLLAKHILL